MRRVRLGQLEAGSEAKRYTVHDIELSLALCSASRRVIMKERDTREREYRILTNDYSLGV